MNQITNNNNESENEMYNKHQNNYKEQLGKFFELTITDHLSTLFNRNAN